MKLRKSDIPKVWLQAFPHYKGRKFKLVVRRATSFSNGAWSGGSKSDYVAIDLRTGQIVDADSRLSNPLHVGPGASHVEIPKGILIAEHVRFCGADLGIEFIVSPESVDLIPALKGV